MILLLIAGFLHTREAGFLKCAETVNGSVADLKRTMGVGGDGHLCCLSIDLTTKAGKQGQFISNVYSDPPVYTVALERL